jgi:hypothetical protein
VLKKMLTTPPIKKIDLVFPLGLEVTARNLRGVTIKDALDAIYKQFKKKVRFLIFATRAQLITSDDKLIFLPRPTTSSATPTSRASSGIARSATPASSSTRWRPVASPQARARRRRRAARLRRPTR